MALTPEQQKMVERNLALATWMADKYAAPYGMDWEDWLAECQAELCRAVAWHDPAKGSLSALFDRLVFLRRSNLNSARRRLRRGYGLKTLSLDFDMAGEANLQDMGALADDRPQRDLDLVEIREFCDYNLVQVSPKAQTVFLALADGRTHTEVANDMGVSRQRITQLVDVARDRLAVQFSGDVQRTRACNRCGGPVTEYGDKKTSRICKECKKKAAGAKAEWMRAYHQERKGETA